MVPHLVWVLTSQDAMCNRELAAAGINRVGTNWFAAQERPEDVPTGELPRNMSLLVDRHLVGKIVPGTRITAVGIYSIMQASSRTASGIFRVAF